MARVDLVAVVVRDYDEAIAFYVDRLGFELIEDTAQPEHGATTGSESSDEHDVRRWVVVRPRGGGTGILLARAATPDQRARVGDQTGGRVFLFLESDDFWSDHARMTTAGVRFVEQPRSESYGTVAVFEDLYGNRWDLIERSADG